MANKKQNNSYIVRKEIAKDRYFTYTITDQVKDAIAELAKKNGVKIIPDRYKNLK